MEQQSPPASINQFTNPINRLKTAPSTAKFNPVSQIAAANQKPAPTGPILRRELITGPETWTRWVTAGKKARAQKNPNATGLDGAKAKRRVLAAEGVKVFIRLYWVRSWPTGIANEVGN